jgi:hypothetical protein
MIKNHNDHIKYGEIQILFLNFIVRDEIDIEPIRIRFYTLRDIQGYTYALKKVKFMIRSIDDFLTHVLPRDLQRGLYYEFLVALRGHFQEILDCVFPEEAKAFTLFLATHKKSIATPECAISTLSKEVLRIIVRSYTGT